jgi:hypothetical protein
MRQTRLAQRRKIFLQERRDRLLPASGLDDVLPAPGFCCSPMPGTTRTQIVVSRIDASWTTISWLLELTRGHSPTVMMPTPLSSLSELRIFDT